MARSLYKSANNSRKIILGILVFFVVVFIWNIISFNNQRQVTLDNEANRFYMKAARELQDVPEPEIPGINYNSSVRFALESVHSSAFPDVSYVYAIDEPRETFLSFENAQETIGKLGFISTDFQEVDENNFRWFKDNSTKSVEYNKRLQRWRMDTLFYDNQAAISRKTLYPDLQQYIKGIGSILSSLTFDSIGIDGGQVVAKYAELGLDGIFIDNNNVNEAEYVFLNVFRILPQADLKPTAELPKVVDKTLIPKATTGKVYSNDPRYGQISMIVSNQMRDIKNDIFRINYTDYEYSTKKGGYLVIAPDEAWSNVQKGQGSLVYFQKQGDNYFGNPIDVTDVSRFVADARRTELAFWEPNEWTGFVYPIYVFNGRAELEDGRQGSFTIFIDAIKRAT